MRVLFASSEIYPFAKTGGLADVCDALPTAMKKEVDISRVMPLYGFMKSEDFKFYDRFMISFGMVEYDIEVFEETERGVGTYFIKAPFLSDTQNLYGDENGDYRDNDLRFTLFSRAIVELGIRLEIDVFHINDWHTALVALFVREFNLNIKTIFTIHNLAYQGVFDRSSLSKFSILDKYFTMDALEFHGNINFMKAGIAYSDSITTVSPSYAKEILTEEFGCGLDGFLRHHQDKLSGILNGINETIFNPSTDKALAYTYDKETLENKHKNKVAFIKSSSLKDPRVPLFVMITRLVEQKGIDLLLESMDELLKKRLNLFIIGDGDSTVCEKLQNLSTKHKNFEFFDGYDEILSHQTYASADFLLMPSSFEPCGLNQFIAMKYGAIAVVHAVGGLKDSVHEEEICGRGIIYEKQSEDELLLAVDRALKLKKNSKKYKSMVRFNMECDFSFKSAVTHYIKLYNQ